MTQAADPQATPQPQYSPDGQWWWTGTEWVPAAQSPQAAPVPGSVPTPPPAAAPVPGFVGVPVAASRTSGLAIAALVLGILWLFGLGSLLALIFGLIALSQIRKSAGTLGGKGMAIAGVVLGGLGLVSILLFTVTGAVVFSKAAKAGNESVLKSDLRDAASAQETYFAEHHAYATSVGDLTGDGLFLFPGDDVQVVSATSTGYCLVGNRSDVATWYYDSTNGGLSTTPCS